MYGQTVSAMVWAAGLWTACGVAVLGFMIGRSAQRAGAEGRLSGRALNARADASLIGFYRWAVVGTGIAAVVATGVALLH
jgi:hypothetical protein